MILKTLNEHWPGRAPTCPPNPRAGMSCSSSDIRNVSFTFFFSPICSLVSKLGPRGSKSMWKPSMRYTIYSSKFLIFRALWTPVRIWELWAFSQKNAHAPKYVHSISGGSWTLEAPLWAKNKNPSFNSYRVPDCLSVHITSVSLFCSLTLSFSVSFSHTHILAWWRQRTHCADGQRQLKASSNQGPSPIPIPFS